MSGRGDLKTEDLASEIYCASSAETNGFVRANDHAREPGGLGCDHADGRDGVVGSATGCHGGGRGGDDGGVEMSGPRRGSQNLHLRPFPYVSSFPRHDSCLYWNGCCEVLPERWRGLWRLTIAYFWMNLEHRE